MSVKSRAKKALHEVKFQGSKVDDKGYFRFAGRESSSQYRLGTNRKGFARRGRRRAKHKNLQLSTRRRLLGGEIVSVLSKKNPNGLTLLGKNEALKR